MLTLHLLVIKVFLCFLLKRQMLLLLAKDCKLAMLSLDDGNLFYQIPSTKDIIVNVYVSDDKLLGA